jgi:hypothetical protein
MRRASRKTVFPALGKFEGLARERLMGWWGVLNDLNKLEVVQGVINILESHRCCGANIFKAGMFRYPGYRKVTHESECPVVAVSEGTKVRKRLLRGAWPLLFLRQQIA